MQFWAHVMESMGCCIEYQTSIILHTEPKHQGQGTPRPSQCLRCYAKLEFLGSGNGEHAESNVE